MLVWLSDAPTYDPDSPSSISKVCEFIDSIIPCDSSVIDSDPEMQVILNRQRHHHTRTCKKKNNPRVKCRFGIPFFPMNTTCILHPLPSSYAPDRVTELKNTLKSIQQHLESINTTTYDRTFDDLAELALPEEEYILAIRSSLSKDKIFLKRRPQTYI